MSLDAMRYGFRAMKLAAIFTLISIVLGLTPGATRAGDFAALVGNHPDGASALAVEAAAPVYRPLQMEIYLSPRNQAERDQLAQDLQDPASPQYHKWLTPDDYDQRFGPTDSDVAQVTSWLTSQGFTVTQASAHERRIVFTGDVATAQNAFLVHIVQSHDGKRFSNLEDPQVPAALAPKIGYLAGLDNLGGVIWHTTIPDPPYDVQATGPLFGPTDIRTFADENPLLNSSPTKFDGTGECIAVSEGSDVDQPSLSQFNTVFGLPAFTSGKNYNEVVVDGPIGAPGSNGGGSPYAEAMLDVEYAHGLAPGAEIVVYATNAGTGNPLAVQDLVDTVTTIVTDNSNNCHTVAISWAQCGEPNAFYITLDGYFQEGAMRGQSIFVATGDVGTAGPVGGRSGCVIPRTPHIEENAASPNVTAVGASEYMASYDDNGNDTSTDANTKQKVWKFVRKSNISFLDAQGASTGGTSKVFAKPPWQKGVAGISGSHRVVPDLVLGGGNFGGNLNVHYNLKNLNKPPKVTGKLFPAPGFWESFDSGLIGGNGVPGGTVWETTGGTSIVPPQYAAIFAIVNQKAATDGQGLINPKLYAMAKANLKHLGTVGILDIVSGNNALYGVTGYNAVKGFDYASGWGAVDINTFVNAFINFNFTSDTQ